MKLEARFNLSRGDFQLQTNFQTGMVGVTGLFGPSGSGKTTFLRCLAGLEKGAKGWLRFGDTLWQDDSLGIFLPAHQRSLGYVFQEGRLFSHLKVADNLAFGQKRALPTKSRVSTEEVVEILALAPLLKRRPMELSGGERQRVAIGRAILSGPDLLVLDEPLASVDHTAKQRILDFIQKIQKRLALPILYVSHDMGEILHLADSLVLMANGAILAYGPAVEMVTRLDLPPAHAADAGTILDTTVVGRDEHYCLNHLAFGQNQLIFTPAPFLTMGARVRLRIFARDVSLTLDPPVRTSILNAFAAKIIEMLPESDAHFIIKLDVSGALMLARITRKSKETLALQSGMQLFAQVKSMALDQH